MAAFVFTLHVTSRLRKDQLSNYVIVTSHLLHGAWKRMRPTTNTSICSMSIVYNISTKSNHTKYWTRSSPTTWNNL